MVAIDDDSLAHERQKGSPPRDYLAQLIGTVAAGKPRVILLDVLFDQPAHEPELDRSLISAIRAAGREVPPQPLDFLGFADSVGL